MWNPFKKEIKIEDVPGPTYIPAEKKLKVPIDLQLEKCLKVVQIEIAEDFREEAKEILMLANKADRDDFIKYHEEDKGNICCLVLDKIKCDLIAEGKMTRSAGDAFGKPFML